MTAIALVPARSGSVRVPGKNVAPLAGHPLIAYTIAAAIESGVFTSVLVSTDSADIAAIAERYGAHSVLRPAELATSESPDIAWVLHAMDGRDDDAFSILRPTSPFRTAGTIRRAWSQFSEVDADSLRAVEPTRQHPGKMWLVDGPLMRPLWEQGDGDVPYHSTQYAALPRVWVQNSSLEIAWTRVLRAQPPTIAGARVAPFFTEGYEGFSIDYPEDLALAERVAASGEAQLPTLDSPP
jgi:CMP-N,N'-diacetyllegionaminic acid synthase